MRKRGMISIIGCLLFGGFMTAHAESPQFSETYNKVMDKLENLNCGESFTAVMETEKTEYDLGSPLEIRLQSEQACYLTLMDISTNGDIAFLVPSGIVPDNKIEPERTYSTLNDFKLDMKVAKPGGYEKVNLFCTAEPFAFFDADFQKEAVYTIPSQDETRLTALLKRLEELEKQEWAGKLTWTGSSVSFLIKGRANIPGGAKGLTKGLPKRGMLPGAPSTGTQGKRLFPPAPSTGTAGHTDDSETPKSSE